MPTTVPSWTTVTITPLAAAALATGTPATTRPIRAPKAPAMPAPETASTRYSCAPP